MNELIKQTELLKINLERANKTLALFAMMLEIQLILEFKKKFK